MKLTAALDALKEMSTEELIDKRIAILQSSVMSLIKEEINKKLLDNKDILENLEYIDIEVAVSNLSISKVQVDLKTKEVSNASENNEPSPLSPDEIVKIMKWMSEKRYDYEDTAKGNINWNSFINNLELNINDITKYRKCLV